MVDNVNEAEHYQLFVNLVTRGKSHDHVQTLLNSSIDNNNSNIVLPDLATPVIGCAAIITDFNVVEPTVIMNYILLLLG